MKIRVLVEVTISCSPPRDVGWRQSLEARARALERWASEFNGFLQDHRSQDGVILSVDRQYQTQCSHCYGEWEENADGPLCCNKAQEEWSDFSLTKCDEEGFQDELCYLVEIGGEIEGGVILDAGEGMLSEADEEFAFSGKVFFAFMVFQIVSPAIDFV